MSKKFADLLSSADLIFGISANFLQFYRLLIFQEIDCGTFTAAVRMPCIVSDAANENAGEGIDVLQLGAGLEAANTQIDRQSSDLVLTVNAADKVRISSYFDKNTVEQIRFADGTTWDYAAVTDKLVYNGTANGEYLYGLSGVANRINGLGGGDYIYGADKNDVLDGGAGSDVLEGRAGNDIFKFSSPDQGSDSISDFTSGADAIHVVASNFGLTTGAGVTLLSGTTTPVATGTAAQFLYNTTSGDLYFDRDGADSAYAAIQIVKLTGQKTLAASDIVVVEM